MKGALQADGRRIYFFGALGGLLFGYDTGVISGAILFITEDFDLSPFMQGAVVASLLLGAMAGAALAGPLSDTLGRRRLIMIAAVTFTVGAIAAAAAPSAWALVGARVILGLAVGCAALVVPLYLSEIAPTRLRGAIGSLNQLMIVVGILVAFIVNAILASSGDWRLMLGLAAVPSLILLVGMAFMPETPRYLVTEGEEDEAKEVLEELKSDDAPAEDDPDKKVDEIREVDEQEDGGSAGLLKEPWVRPALVVAIGLAVFQPGGHQHDHLLRADHAHQRRLRRGRSDLRQPRHRNAERGHDGAGDPARRPRRTQADAAGGPRGHDREPGDPGRVHRGPGQAGLARRSRGDRHPPLPGRLHRLVCRHMGPGGVGGAAGGAAAERARDGHGDSGVPALGSELPRLPELPDHARLSGAPARCSSATRPSA